MNEEGESRYKLHFCASRNFIDFVSFNLFGAVFRGLYRGSGDGTVLLFN